MKTYNLNYNVTVTLTDRGREIWRAYWDGAQWSLDKIDKDGRLRAQLWVIMQVFGEHMSNGCTLPMSTEIELDDVEYTS